MVILKIVGTASTDIVSAASLSLKDGLALEESVLIP
jgi:hypothetical protein